MTTDIINTKAVARQANSAQSCQASTAQNASPPSSSPPTPPRKPRKLICLKEVAYRLGVSRATVYRLKDRCLAGKGTFPLPVQIGPGRIGWHEHEVETWIESRPRIEGRGSNDPHK